MADNNKQLQEAKKLLQEINTLRARLNQQPLNLTDSEAVAQVQSLRNELKGVQRSFEDVDDSATSLYDQIRAISSEFKNQPGALQKIRGSMKKITSIAEDLKMQEQGIKDLSTKQLDDLTQKLKYNKKVLDDESTRLLNGEDLSDIAQKEVQALQDLLKEQGGLSNMTRDQVDAALELVNVMDTLTAEQKAALSNYVDQGNALNGIQDKIDVVIEQQKEVNRLMGVGGAVVDGLDGLMGKLGMSSSRFKDAVAEAKEQMLATAEAIQSGAQKGNKLTVLMAGLGPLAKGFAAALFDPLTIIMKIVDSYFKVDKAATEFQRLTGMSAESLAGANTELATSVDFLETAGELTKQLGVNAAVVLGPDLVAAAAGLKNEMGLSAENAGVLALNAKMSGNSMQQTLDTIQSSTDAFNATTDSAVSATQVVRDMGKASKAVQAQFMGYPGGLAKAAAAARKIGLELKDMEGIMDSLLNFEDSIAAEMEAELLTGKDLNLNRARELSLANDMEGVANELFKNAQDVHDFSKMNRIQQEAYAKSLGMSRDQLAEMAIQKGLLVGMTDEEKAKVRGVTLEESKRMDVQEKIQASIEKLSQAFAPILSIIGDIVDLIAPLVQLVAGAVGWVVKLASEFGIVKYALYGIVAIIAMGKIGSFFGMLSSGFSTFKDNIKEAGGLLKSVKDKFTKGFTGAQTPATPEALPGADKTADAANAATKTKKPTTSGKELKDFFKNLAAGLREMGTKEVLFGALNLIPASLGLVAFIPGYLGAKLLESLDSKKLKQSLVGLADGFKAFGDNIKGILAFGLATVSFVAVLAAIPGMLAVAYLSKPVASGLDALAKGLLSFGESATNPMMWMGIAALAAFGVAMIPVAYAISLLSPAIEALGNVILKVFQGIALVVTAAADGFVKLMDSVTFEKVQNMALLGPALAGVALGLAAFSTAMAGGSIMTGLTSLFTGGGLLSDLTTLATLAAPLQSVAGSLTAIAGALTGIGVALATVETEKLKELEGLVTTTAFAAPMVAAAGAIGDMIAGIAGGGKEETSNDAVVAKLDELIAAVKAGGDVKIDGRKVGEHLALTATNTK